MGKKHLDWDDDVPEDIKAVWSRIEGDLIKLSSISIHRCITAGSSKDSKFEIITFTDASKDAYAAVVYLKTSDRITANVNLIFSKSRLASIKKISIPRLELLGMLIGCRISKYVTTELKIDELRQTLFTDSKCVLDWCMSKKKLKRFVRDKTEEIQSHDIRIGYVKSEENPADLAVRGKRVRKLMNGPKWLISNNDIPVTMTYEMSDEVRNQIRSEEMGSEVLHEVSTLAEDTLKVLTPFEINESKFSSHTRLVRVTAWCIRFINNIRKSNIKSYLSDKEIADSSKLWTKSIQERHFSEVCDDTHKRMSNSVS